MIDLHCHILPGLDDGSENMLVSLDMARAAVQSGVEWICATPHCCRHYGWNGGWAQDVQKVLERFRRELELQNIPLRVAAGMEVCATDRLPELFDAGRILTLAGSRYLLLEFYFDETEENMEDAIELVRSVNLVPVIAHPERYEAVQQNPALAGWWFSRGNVLQVNKGSILGQLGRKSEETAWWLLEQGLAHLVASDAHSVRFRTAGFGTVSRRLQEAFGGEYADLLLRRNPKRILRDRELVLPADFITTGF